MTGFSKNTHREMAAHALAAYREIHPDYRNNPNEPDSQAMADLICGLMMTADYDGEDAGKILAAAQMHFEAEN